MKIEEQTLSLEQMQHLNELGLKVEDTALAWVNARVGLDFVAPISMIFHNDYIPTLTLHEILEMLPEEILASNGHKYIISTKGKYYIAYEVHNHPANILHNEFETSPLYAAYKMLCWVLKNGYLNKG